MTLHRSTKGLPCSLLDLGCEGQEGAESPPWPPLSPDLPSEHHGSRAPGVLSA